MKKIKTKFKRNKKKKKKWNKNDECWMICFDNFFMFILLSKNLKKSNKNNKTKQKTMWKRD